MSHRKTTAQEGRRRVCQPVRAGGAHPNTDAQTHLRHHATKGFFQIAELSQWPSSILSKRGSLTKEQVKLQGPGNPVQLVNPARYTS